MWSLTTTSRADGTTKVVHGFRRDVAVWTARKGSTSASLVSR